MKHCKGLGRGLATLTIGILLLGAIAPLFASYQASAAGITWHTEMVDSSGNVGYYTSLDFDSDGDPAISYFDYAQADLKYAHWNGSSWVVETVDSTGQVGLYTSLAFDADGNPGISYYDATNYHLKYAHWDGTKWNIETVDSTDDVGSYTSLAFDNSGKPSISYYDAYNGNLKYAHWNGSKWIGASATSSAPETVDSEGNVGTYTSLAFDNSGNPSISYYDVTNTNLKYAHWNGSSWVGMTDTGKPDTVDSTVPEEQEDVGRYTSLAFDAIGYPGISYYDVVRRALKFAHWNGSSWEIVIVDPSGNVGQYTSLAFDPAGYPSISYDDCANHDLKYARQKGSTWVVETVDEADNVGTHTSLDFDNAGNPCISYYDATNGYLKYATTAVRPTSAPYQPDNTSPADGAVNIILRPTLHSSDFSDPDADDTHAASWWQVATDDQFINIIYDSGSDSSNLISITMPSGRLSYETTYYWRVKYQDYYVNWSSWSEETSFTTITTSPPNLPINIYPVKGATEVCLSPILNSSTFSDFDAGDTHTASQWQIRTSTGGYSSPLFDSGVDASNLTQIALPSGILSPETTYYWHVKHRDSYNNWSSWSEETPFTTTAMQLPTTPTNASPSNGATGIAIAPKLMSSPFSDPDVGDSHAASWWQVATDDQFTNIVYDSGSDDSNLISITIPPGRLSYEATYYWRVKHQDYCGNWSDWSEETSFTTMASGAPAQPGNISPADEATDISLTPTLRSSVFSDPDVGDAHAASRWQIRTSTGDYDSPLFDSGISTTNLTQFSPPLGRLGYEATYYWRVKYQDVYGNWSSWSEETSFTTVTTSPPNLPINTSPAEGASEVSLTLVLKSSAFSDPDVVDNHGASQWQIRSSDGDYDSPVFDSETDTTNLTEIALPSGTLSPNTTYYWQVRHQDSYSNWSAYSQETSFATITVPAPEAGFSVSAEEVEVGQSITFTDLSEEATSWIWDLGDGTAREWSIINRPRDGQFSHTYTTAGTYTVSLTASNLAGSHIQTADITVYATPQANFSAPAQALEGQSLTLTDLSAGEIDSWKWIFGDGTTRRWDVDTRPEDGKLTHAYDTAGSYTVSLEVSGPRGSHTQTKTVTVLAPPAEGFKFSTWMIGAIVGGILVIAGLVYLIWRRRAEAS